METHKIVIFENGDIVAFKDRDGNIILAKATRIQIANELLVEYRKENGRELTKYVPVTDLIQPTGRTKEGEYIYARQDNEEGVSEPSLLEIKMAYYEELLGKSDSFIKMYERMFGKDAICTEYHEMKSIIDKIKTHSHETN